MRKRGPKSGFRVPRIGVRDLDSGSGTRIRGPGTRNRGPGGSDLPTRDPKSQEFHFFENPLFPGQIPIGTLKFGHFWGSWKFRGEISPQGGSLGVIKLGGVRTRVRDPQTGSGPGPNRVRFGTPFLWVRFLRKWGPKIEKWGPFFRKRGQKVGSESKS